jgi:hypothetical protein
MERGSLRIITSSPALSWSALLFMVSWPLSDALAEHLGLFQPLAIEEITSSMHPAPVPLTIEKNPDDARVADPLGDIVQVWEATAEQNRAAFEAIFKPLPSDSVRNKDSYRVSKNHAGIINGYSSLQPMPIRCRTDLGMLWTALP